MTLPALSTAERSQLRLLAKAALKAAKDAHARAATDLYLAAAGATQPELPLSVDGDE